MEVIIPPSESRTDARRAFLWASVATVCVVVLFIAWMELRFGGDQVTIAVDDIGEAIAAFVAAACCVVAARRSSGRQRAAWWLIAASSVVWGAGEVAWSVYELGLGLEVPFPSIADAGFLGSMPLAAAGVLLFVSGARGTSTRLRLWLDGAIVFASLLFVAWGLGLSTVYHGTGDSQVAKAIELAYPFGDIVIGTIVVLAIRRATVEAHGRLLLLLGGLAANSLADSAFAFLTADGAFGAIGSVLDVGWVAGFLMIALAALWPQEPASRPALASEDDRAVQTWQIALPWLPILAAGLTAILVAVTGQVDRPILTVIAGAILVMVTISQVYAHNESQALLKRTRLDAATLDDMLLYAPLGVVRVGRDQRIIQTNPRFVELMGRPASELVGTPLAAFLRRDDVIGAGRLFDDLARGTINAVDSETEGVRGDGTAVWLHWSATVVRTSDGQVDYFIAMFQDTTARHDAEVAAASNLSVLERLNRLKSEFLTSVSHEIRTALVGIQGFSELMRDSEQIDAGSVRVFATDIFNDAHRLDEMLASMLDLDRLEAAKPEVHMVATDLGLALTGAVARARSSDGSHVFTVDLDPGLPPVMGDASRLSQLLGILLGNAVKYSAGGTLVAASCAQRPGQLVVTVSDQGPGMPADFDLRLYARNLAGAAPAPAVIGRGLSLPIARQIVGMHGGQIWFETRPGLGSDFHFSVPTQGMAGAAAQGARLT
jgi:two-component system, sensor histidine kinase and response regulator